MADRPRAAILGASGFIGSRLVESLVLRNLAEVRPIVRSFKGMARLARFDLDCRVADATDRVALETQLAGCNVLFHCVLGGRETILKSAESAYLAAAKAGVRRLIYLSSAVVHGYDPEPATHDDSKLVAKQACEYNVSKVMAEHQLRRLREDGAVEVVTLRPSIVFGPRSQWWSAQIATDLLTGRAYLIDGGSGICNTVYVDNLVQAMWQSAISDRAANQDFIITDGERVTWGELYGAVGSAMGIDIKGVPSITSEDALEYLRSARQIQLRDRIAGYRLARAVREILPPSMLERIKQPWNVLPAPNGHSVSPSGNGSPIPAVEAEMFHLQRCRYVLPIRKAREVLRYEPKVTFREGCRRTGEWLRFAFGMDVHKA